MKIRLNLKSLYRSMLVCSFGLAFGLVDHLVNAQDAEADAPATEVGDVGGGAEDYQPAEEGYEEEPVGEYFPAAPIGSPDSELNFQTYGLSYMQSDRVIALLKALGYATVEFAWSEGESINERIYSVLQEGESYPLVIKLIDTNKTSLLELSPDGVERQETGLGGTYLHQQT
ncbi:MAG TPA: hypothetical protein QGG93_04895, partial [Verrucomicrobiota bacterium]|nr:hypothetical protein [Verrucomicrobiota bacterium]